MNIPLSVFKQLLALVLVLVIGYAARLFGALDKNTTKKLGAFVMSVSYPLMIMMAFQQKFSAKNLGLFCTVFGIAFVLHLVPTFLVLFMFRTNKITEASVLRFSVIIPSGGFIGIPLLKIIFGDLGAFYGASFLLFSTLYTWTVGAFMLSAGRKRSLKTQLKALVSPSLIGAVVGFLLFLCHIQLPAFCATALNLVGDMSVPLSMLILGSTLREISLKDAFFKADVYIAAAVKLVAFPFVVLVLCLILGISKWTAYTCILLSALPTNASVVYTAERFGASRTKAIACAEFINILSVVTVPLVMAVAGLAVK